jgi:hypothetical protein
VVLAARGVRNLDDGYERVRDPGELREQRRQAAKVLGRGVGWAGLVVGVLTLGLRLLAP